jgi:hypothetical protein
VQATIAESNRPTFERWAFYVLVLLAVGLFVIQLGSLYQFPVYDSYLWWGDESWLTLEFRSQITTGVFQHPLALGASIHNSSGLLLGNMWLTAVLYGGAAAIFTSLTDPVTIGRSVTAVLSVILLLTLYRSARKLGISKLFATAGVLLLLTSRSFMLTSHSARYDILTALAILCVLSVLERLVAREDLPNQILFFFGVSSLALAIISIHVVLLSAALFAIALWKLNASRQPKKLIAFSAGVLTSMVGFIFLQWITQGTLQLFGKTRGKGFLANVAEVPLLRPFSRSVQAANLAQRVHVFSDLAIFILVVAVCSLIVAILTRQKVAGKKQASVSRSMLTPGVLAILLSWMFLESSAPTSYLIYVLPVLVLLSMKVLDRDHGSSALVGRRNIVVALLLLVVCSGAFSYIGSHTGERLGSIVTTSNERAITNAISAIRTDSHEQAPLVLAFNPAISRLLNQQDVRVMTTQFIEYPATELSPHDLLKSLGVRYLLLYRSALKPYYMREVGPLDTLAQQFGKPIATSAGIFTDIGRSYFEPRTPEPVTTFDSLIVYRLDF